MERDQVAEADDEIMKKFLERHRQRHVDAVPTNMVYREDGEPEETDLNYLKMFLSPEELESYKRTGLID
ncbi:MAG: hypothetical protein CL489_15525 [Acidobacteria bacterium]|nr:hypothetical protein [Acidobacteriota bacterium]|tara:strand:- start:94 stop:300 length:207 start_codon:yes stop_codon:yes gene_type:complete